MQRGWRRPGSQKVKKAASTEERNCQRDDNVRENIAVQMQAGRKFKGKDHKEQAILIVPYSPHIGCHHPLGRHGQLHVC